MSESNKRITLAITLAAFLLTFTAVPSVTGNSIFDWLGFGEPTEETEQKEPIENNFDGTKIEISRENAIDEQENLPSNTPPTTCWGERTCKGKKDSRTGRALDSTDSAKEAKKLCEVEEKKAKNERSTCVQGHIASCPDECILERDAAKDTACNLPTQNKGCRYVYENVGSGSSEHYTWAWYCSSEFTTSDVKVRCLDPEKKVDKKKTEKEEK